MINVMEVYNQVVGFLNGIVWSSPLVYGLLAVGLYFSIRTKFVQFRLFPTMCKLLFAAKESEKGISSFQAMCTALAGRVGTGNIAGTALAIYWGGPGAIFWMWLSAILGASTTYIESALAQQYKVEIDGQWRGGPAAYIEFGMKQRWYSLATAVVVLLTCGILLPGTQSYSITSGFVVIFGDTLTVKLIVATIVTACLGIIIFGGVKRIAHFAEWCVPIMAIVYVILALVIIVVNIGEIGNVLRMIFAGAFGADAAFGGILGSTIAWGVKRGVYSNEAGQGTQPHAAAAAEVDHPAKQGLVQGIGVYIDTLFVCSATAFMVLMTDTFNTMGGDGNYLHIGAGGEPGLLASYAEQGIYGGSEFTQAAVNGFIPGFGNYFVAICLAFFAFTTILSYYYQAESNLAYLFRKGQVKTRKTVTLLIRLFMMLMTFTMCLNKVAAVWDSGDLGVGLLAWFNLIAILILQAPALRMLKDYEEQRKLPGATYDSPWYDPRKGRAKDCNVDVWEKINADKMGA